MKPRWASLLLLCCCCLGCGVARTWPRSNQREAAALRVPSSFFYLSPAPGLLGRDPRSRRTFPQQRSLLPKALIPQDRDLCDAPKAPKYVSEAKLMGRRTLCFGILKPFLFSFPVTSLSLTKSPAGGASSLLQLLEVQKPAPGSLISRVNDFPVVRTLYHVTKKFFSDLVETAVEHRTEGNILVPFIWVV